MSIITPINGSYPTPSAVSTLSHKTQTGVNIIDGIGNDLYYFFVSSFDPWFAEVGGVWTVSPDDTRVYNLDTVDGQNAIKEQMVGIKRLYSNNVRLVANRNNDITGSVGNPIPLDTSLTPANRFIVSESAISASPELYVYNILQGATSAQTFNASHGATLAEEINEANINNTRPYIISDVNGNIQAKLLYKIQGDDLKFVTTSYIPVMETGEFSSVQDRVRLLSTNGEMLVVKVLAGGTNYLDGEKVTITNGTGSGFYGRVRVVGGGPGPVFRVDVDSPGFGYRVPAINPNDPNNTINPVDTPVVTTASGTGVSLKVEYAPTGGYGSDPVTTMDPSNIMFYSTVAAESIEPGSPFPTDTNGFTFGIIKSPMKNSTNRAFDAAFGKGFTKITVKSLVSTFTANTLPPLYFDIKGARVDIRVVPLVTNSAADYLVSRIHEGKLLKYEVNPIDANSIDLYFVDKDISGLGWSDTTTYAIQFVLYSELENGAVDQVPSNAFAQVVLSKPVEKQDVLIGSGEIIFAARVSVPTSTQDYEQPWIVKDNIIKEWRLTVPLV